MIKKRTYYTGMLLLALSQGNSFAVGFRLPNQDPDAIARGNAFVATADNPSAVYYNPAGITQLDGYLLRVGLYNISTGVDFTAADGRTARADSSFQTIPQIYYTASPEDSNWSYGLGVYAPYGLGVDYGQDTPFSTVAVEGSLAYLTVNPVVAYQVNPCLSVAAGLTLNYSDIGIQKNITGVGNRFEFEGDAYAVGFNLGVMWQPHSQWSFGLSYRSETEMDYEGSSEVRGFFPMTVRSDTSASLTFPQHIDAGVSYRPNSRWNIEFNVDWTDWDAVNASVLKTTPLGDQVFPFHYHSSFMYELGVTRYLENGYYVSAGYIFSENSVPDQTFTPLNPDANLHLGSIGIGRKTDKLSWALAYHFAYNEGRKVNGSARSVILESSDGEYEVLNHAVNFSITYAF
ncbi:MAG: outer membrane protein transport protein [Akkermansiaceae bacterium]|nr:outer membrane protein transport protein [Akkermansiaceae bacterium]